ncbi:MAG TPA: alpha/beta fold hydrolase [Polyangiaceae bacterium]|nr:alpha/beta fold hydrolase [Polyangiaceae bacterium]
MLTVHTVSRASRSVVGLAMVALGTLLGACGGRVDEEAGDERLEMEAPTEEGWVGFFRPSKPKLDFKPCEGAPGLECAKLEVPLDYSDGDCDTTDISVARLPSTSSKGPKKGVLFLAAGGPGSSGIDQLRAMTPFFSSGKLRENFDIVTFDARGVGRSNAVRCDVVMPPRPADANDDEALAAYFDEFGHRVADACLEQNGPLAKHVGTNNVARDLDVLRKALGEQEITVLGYSYGSALGAVYANLFPKRVRAMVLDAAVAPTFVDSLTERARDSAAASEQALARLDQLCKADPSCPLQKVGITAALDLVTAKLDAAPVAVGPGQAPMTGDDVRFLVMGMLYNERAHAPLIVASLATAAAGNVSVLKSVLPLARSNSAYLLGGKARLDALTVVTCNDFGTRREANDYLDLARTTAKVSPHFGGLFGDLLRSTSFAAAQCRDWPDADVPRIEDVSERVKTPIMIVGNDFDNASPLSRAQSLGKALGMEEYVLRYQGGGHTIYGLGSACINSKVDAYLIDRKTPPAGTSCAAEPVPFTFPASAASSPETGLYGVPSAD